MLQFQVVAQLLGLGSLNRFVQPIGLGFLGLKDLLLILCFLFSN